MEIFAPAPSISQNKNGTCNNELQVCNVAHYLISTVSAVPPYPPWVNITNMQQTVLNFKKSTFGNKKYMFYWKTPKIKGRWRVKVYTLTYIYINIYMLYNAIIYIYIYVYIYNYIYTHHQRFKEGGRTQNVSYIFFNVFLRGSLKM